MNGEFLLDTNALISLIKKDTPLENLSIKTQFYLSIISEMELLSYSKLSILEEQLISSVLNSSCVINITEEIKKMTIRLRKSFNLKLPDAIIAATAIVKGLTLVTDDKTFNRVSGLNVTSVNNLLS